MLLSISALSHLNIILDNLNPRKKAKPAALGVIKGVSK
jgi:hypothetical protein